MSSANSRPAAGTARLGRDRQGRTYAEKTAHILASHPERDWRLRDLADEVHLSTSQLGRVFMDHFGVPPMQYLARVRAHRLARLLAETDLPVGMAMRRVGWHSRGHASRQFQAITGMQPSVYRKAAATRDAERRTRAAGR